MIHLDVAREYIGTPYHQQAREKGRAIDCIGLIVCVCHECGIPLEDKEEWRNGTISKVSGRFFGDYDIKPDPRPGDVVVFGEKRPAHLGWYTGETLIHVHTKCVEEIPFRCWADKFLGAIRFGDL